MPEIICADFPPSAVHEPKSGRVTKRLGRPEPAPEIPDNPRLMKPDDEIFEIDEYMKAAEQE